MAEKPPELDRIIRQFRGELERRGIRPERILLFGSHARGEARDESDIDLIIVSPDWTSFNRRERLELLGVAAIHIMESVQAQGFTPEEIDRHQTGAFWEEILRNHAVAV